MTDVAMEFREKVSLTIARRGLPPAGARVIVGLSGGADSVALLAVMTEMSYDCVAAHMNYGLRGEESDRDMECARRVATRLGVAFRCRRVEVDADGVSVEMACRDLRYSWFRELLAQERAEAVAVAHHMEDSVETFVLNALRRTGIAGLCGIRASGDGLMRPLTDVSRDEIESYLARRGLEFVIDSSNATDDYKRNRVRHHVLPALEMVSPGAADSIAATIGMLSEQSRMLDRFVAARRDSIADGAGGYRIASLVDEPEFSALMFAMFHTSGFSRAQTDAMAIAASMSGTRYFTAADGLRWVVADGVLRHCCDDDALSAPVSVASSVFDLGDGVIAETIGRDSFSPQRDASVAYFDMSVNEGDPCFELRCWRTGDRIEPFGMAHGSKLVSDVLREARIDADKRASVRVLTRDGIVIWVVGVRASRRFAVGDQTQSVVRLRVPDQRRDS